MPGSLEKRQRRVNRYLGAMAEAVLAEEGAIDKFLGDDVNTAKRLQEHSGTDQVLLSSHAYEPVRDRVEVRALDPIKVKGLHRRLDVYEVLRL